VLFIIIAKSTVGREEREGRKGGDTFQRKLVAINGIE